MNIQRTLLKHSQCEDVNGRLFFAGVAFNDHYVFCELDDDHWYEVDGGKTFICIRSDEPDPFHQLFKFCCWSWTAIWNECESSPKS